MSVIRLQLLAGQDLASAGIEYFTIGPYSHIDAIADDGRLYGARSDRVGDAPAGVEFRDPSYPGSVSRTIYTIPCTQQQRDDYWKFLLAQEHAPYDWRAIVGFAIQRGQWRDHAAWICSELQAAAAEAAQLVAALELPSWRITPNAWSLVLSSIPGRSREQRTSPLLLTV